jgi:hypothetical protein
MPHSERFRKLFCKMDLLLRVLAEEDNSVLKLIKHCYMNDIKYIALLINQQRKRETWIAMLLDEVTEPERH